MHRDRAQLYYDKLAKRCATESYSLRTQTGTSRLSTTLKSQLSFNFCFNFFEVRIATIRGKLSGKLEGQDPESSPTQLYRCKKCHYKSCGGEVRGRKRKTRG